jgi:hypothetical protein
MFFHHFILTRFNLPLWTEDKCGCHINRVSWLEERMSLFEKYCLPSVIGQTNHNFTWILLCDEKTPEEYRERIKGYKRQLPLIELIQVEENYAWDFPNIFSEVVSSMLELKGANDGDVCVTTQLDNDDAINKDYVDFIQRYVSDKKERFDSLSGSNPLFLSFDYGLQYFVGLNMATKVRYSNNHFMTCVEKINGGRLACVYGYGSHFLLEKEYGVYVEHIVERTKSMWCEIIHYSNVDNDVKITFDTAVVVDSKILQKEFNIDIILQVCLFPFFIKATEQVFRRTKGKFIRRKWR